MKAVVLAAGEGTRLKPLTNVRPKPMLPVGNRPLLDHVVTAVSAAGIDEVVLVVGYKRERIQSFFGDGDDWGVDIEYAVQEKQLGTGHAVLQAEPYVDDEFVVLNGDRVIDADAVEQVVAGDVDGGALVAVTPSERPRYYGVVELDGRRVTAIHEKPPAHAVPTNIVNAGIYHFGADVFDAIRETQTEGELAITAALARYVDGGRLRAVRYDGQWLDVSHHWDLLSVNRAVLDRVGGETADDAVVSAGSHVAGDVAVGEGTYVGPNATVLPGTALGDNVRVGANAVLSNCVVFSDATVGAGAVLADCIVGANAIVGPNATAEGGSTDVVVNGHYHEGVVLGGVVGDNASVGGGVTVAPGTNLGDDATVESGAHLDGRIESGATVRRG